MGSKPEMRTEDFKKDSNVNYDSTIYPTDSKVSRSFSLKIREILRVILRSPCGRETLSDLRIIEEKTSEYEIPPAFLEGQEVCKRFVGHVLSNEGIDSKIQQCAVPNIAKEAITKNRLCGEEEKGFLIEAEVNHVKQTLWGNCLTIDQERPIEKECIICLEELSLSSGEEEEEKTIMKLRCGHNFHKDCLYSWLRHKQSCPTCRGGINYQSK